LHGAFPLMLFLQLLLLPPPPPPQPLCLLFYYYYCWWNGDSVVGIVTGYGLDDRGVGVRVPVGSIFLFSTSSRPALGAHPASYTMGTGALCPGVKWPEREADH
jgi:hypothetical protein